MIGASGLVVFAAVGVGYWAWKSRDPQAMRMADVAAVVGGVLGAVLLSRGNALPGVIGLGGAFWWYWFRRNDTRSADDMSKDEALRLLDLPAHATAADIKTAHRRLIARVHPDAGGSADLTRQVNIARDVLLANRRP